jgi:Family of unknown function (DUF6000)
MNDYKYIQAHFVNPLISVTNGSFLNRNCEDIEIFVNSTRVALNEITDREIRWLYENNYWRDTITASWLCGIGRFSQHLQKIETLLIPSRVCYAGQLHCFALARFDNTESVIVLKAYLDTYLPVGDREYDQEWAIGALRWLDRKHETDYAGIYLNNTDNWKVVIMNREYGIKDPNAGISLFQKISHCYYEISPSYSAEIQSGN